MGVGRRSVSWLVLGVLLLGLGLDGAVGQVVPDDGPDDQAPPTIPLLSPERVRLDRGESFEITFMVPESDPNEVRLSLPSFPPGLVLSEGPVSVSRALRDIEVRMTVTATGAGRMVIDPITVTTSDGRRRTPPILAEVSDPRIGGVPFFARWRILSEDVIQGQSVPVLLEIDGVDRFAYPEVVSLRAPETGLFEEVSGIGSATSVDVAGVTMYRIPVAAFLFTPAAAGNTTIPAATVRAEGITIEAPAARVTVEALPEAARESGAVGRFDLRMDVQPTSVSPGETGTVRLTIEGEGNLPVMEFPPVSFEGASEVDRSERSTFGTDRERLAGYSGSRVLEVRFEAQPEASQVVVNVAAFASVDPVDGSLTSVPPRSITVDVERPETAPAIEQVVPEADLIGVQELTGVVWVPLAEMPWVYALFLFGPVLFAAIRLLSVRGAPVLSVLPILMAATLFPSVGVERLQHAAQIAEEGRPDVAAVLYDLELQSAPWHAGLHFNRGVLAVKSENMVDAIFHLRRAVRLAPEERSFRTVLSDAEAFFGLEDQPAIPWYPRPDLLVAAFLVIWTVFWFLLSIRQRLRRTIGLVSLVMVGILVAGGWWWAYRQAETPEALVTRSVTVRRIPDSSAQPWIQVSEATTVFVELSYDEFYLVRTAAGVTGWVPEAALWLHGGEQWTAR